MSTSPSLTKNLRNEYQKLFNSLVIVRSRQKAVDQLVAKVVSKKAVYEKASIKLGCPWFFVAAIHNLESSLNFKKHLHNGDPLSARTVRIPAGRPRTGKPPFSWEESAADALRLKSVDKWRDWSIPGLLFKLEQYNGWGYRKHHPTVLSPYLWSFSNHYKRGKYVADGRWSASSISEQCGAATLIRRLSELGHIDLERSDLLSKDLDELKNNLEKLRLKVSFSAKRKSRSALELQQTLNQFPGIYLKPDGIPGRRTSDALKKVTGHILQGDPTI